MERVGLAPGTELGGYRIIAPLGLGGSGTVYRATDGGGALVALKLLHSHLDSDPVARQRLGEEVLALQRIQHPRVSRVLDAELDSDQAFIVTELIDAPSLRDEVRAAGPYSGEDLQEFAESFYEAVASVHGAGIVHRDLTPANVLVRHDGPVLIDFGIAKLGDGHTLTQAGSIIGTPGYVAPEVLAGGASDATSDWWSWASVLGFAALGRSPFGSGSPMEIAARIQSGIVDCAGLDVRLAEALRQALHPDPTARLSPRSFLDQLVMSIAAPSEAVGVPRTAAFSGATEPGLTAVLGATSATLVTPPPPPPSPQASPVAAQQPSWETHQGGDSQHDWLGHEEAVPSSPQRFYLPLAIWALLTICGAALWPGWALVSTVAIVLTIRLIGEVSSFLEARRDEFGERPSDRWMAALRSPWLLIKGTVGSLPSLLVAASTAFIIWGFGWFAIGDGSLGVPPFPGSEAAPDGVTEPWLTGVLLACAMLLFVIVSWWGPGARLTRRGGRICALRLRSVPLIRSVLIGLCVLALAALAWLWMTGAEPLWSPLPVPPAVGQG